MNNIFKMIFFTTLVTGTLISISSYSWLGTWMGLEINLISFIPMINNSKNIYSTESSMKYFLVQAIASTSFLFSIILMMIINSMNEIYIINEFLLMIMNSSLFMKMGAAPFHFWFPEVMSKMNWFQSMMLLTWQKIAPMVLIMYNLNNSMFFIIIIICSITVGSILGLNQTSMQKIISYSSINHIGWMLSSMLIMENTWMIYFFVYSTITISLILILKTWNIYHIKQIFLNMNSNMIMKFSFIINFLSLGGLPPFLGFLPKWIIIQNLIHSNYFMLNFCLIMMSIITLFFYLRITFSTLMFSYNEMSWNSSFKSLKNKKLLFFINMMSMFGLMFSTIVINMI